jgi:monoglucosyldiacylglycerol epimerase
MIWGIFVFVVQAVVVFVVSTALFDALHWALHRWEKSPNPLLRRFSSWHWVHHKFLGMDMQVNPAYVKANIWFHVLPEYLTSMLGTLVFLFVFPWEPVALVAVIRTIMLLLTLREEGIDFNHMAMDRVGGQQGRLWVDNNYHAMHHVYPTSFFSSFSNAFDLLFGTGCQIEGRRFVVTGAGGAYGSAMVERLKQAGAIVERAKSGVDFAPGNYDGIRQKLENAEVLVLAHGAKTDDCWNANYTTFRDLVELFTDLGKARLTAPEVWAVGSEVEFHGDMGLEELKAYSASKRAYALKAREFYRSDDLIYRHIVPSSFTSAMGKGAMSADTAVRITLSLIRRGFRYVPVTLTGLAVLNYFRFRYFQKGRPDDLKPVSVTP